MSPSGSSGKAVALCSAAARAARRHRRAVAIRRDAGACGTHAVRARRVGRRAGQAVSGGRRGERRGERCGHTVRVCTSGARVAVARGLGVCCGVGPAEQRRAHVHAVGSRGQGACACGGGAARAERPSEGAWQRRGSKLRERRKKEK